jgi:hypothetical protein
MDLSHLPIQPQIGLQVPEFVARSDFETNALRTVPVDQQLAIAKDSDDEVNRGSIQHDQLDRKTKELLHLSFEAETKPRQSLLGIFGIEDTYVDIAPRPGRPPSHAAEEIGRGDPLPLGARGQEFTELGLDDGWVHGMNYRGSSSLLSLSMAARSIIGGA